MNGQTDGFDDGNSFALYDGLNRVVSETTPQGNIAYSYDAAGRRTGMTVRGQQPVSNSFDNGNRLLQMAQASSEVKFSYNDDGRRTSLTLPNGVTQNDQGFEGKSTDRHGYRPGTSLTEARLIAGIRT